MATDLRIKERLPEVTDRIVDTYQEMETINHLGHCPLPSAEVVVEIAEDLKEILYPGYRRRQNLHLANVTYHVGNLVDSLHDRLTQQIARALRHDYRHKNILTGNASQPDFDGQGQEKAIDFLSTLPMIRRVLATDVQAAFDGDPAAGSLDEIIFCYPGLEAITVYRLAHELHRLKVPLIPRMLSELAHGKTGIDIHPGASIGPSFFIDHGTGVVIGATCEISSHVKLYQGVTLGALSFAKDEAGNLVRNSKRHPTIEDHVVIYANATVLGGTTTIGRYSVIGAGASVYESVARNTVVTLEKPTLRMRQAS